MFSRFFKGLTRKSTTLPLGRWNTIIREKESSSDFVSNAIPAPISKQEQKNKDVLKMFDDPHFPFIL